MTMLDQYENDYHTGLDVNGISKCICEYTFGYPVLVSRICKTLDEKLPETEEFAESKLYAAGEQEKNQI